MSGGGIILEKMPYRFRDSGEDCIRYRVMSEYRKGWFDETFVCAAPSDDEPEVGETIWWGGGAQIRWGEGDKNTLRKVGFSWRASGE